jgi:hypothetical protein
VSQEAILSVRVTPRSSRDELQGWQDGVLRVRLKAPPVDGRANEALCRYLASLLGVPAGDVTVVGGQTARIKRLRVEGLAADEMKTRLGG